MRLVAVCKEPSAFRAFPQWSEVHNVCRSLKQKSDLPFRPLLGHKSRSGKLNAKAAARLGGGVVK
jgi:hypothetical protein